MSQTTKEQDGKAKALAAALAGIEKNFGKGSIMQMDSDSVQKVPAYTTRCLALDLALGIGGICRGRVVEIFGPESSGKTTICLQVAAQVQSEGGTVAFIDAEHALDPLYAKHLGVRLEDMLVSQPDCGEDALDIAEALTVSGAVDLIVIDSVAALTPRAELEGAMGDNSVGLQARLMGKALRKLVGNIRKTNTTVMFTNQLREKVGVMFGSPETTPGGKALKFYASQRLDIRRIGAVKEGEEVVGNKTKVKVVKNKTAPPFKVAEFEIHYGEGVSLVQEIIDYGTQQGLITKSGSFFSLTATGEKLGQGAAKTRAFLRDNPETHDSLLSQIRQNLGIDDIPEDFDAVEADDADDAQAALEAELDAEEAGIS